VAQSVAQLIRNQQVVGSIPTAGSRKIKGLWDVPIALFDYMGKFFAHISMAKNSEMRPFRFFSTA
jgi:hypothetical protein